MTIVGFYVAGTSWLHRTPPGLKLLVMLAAGIGSLFLHQAWQVLVASGAVLCLYGAARVSLRNVVVQLRPLAWVIGFVAAFHMIVNGWERAVVVAGVLTTLVLLAGLVTLTTRTTDMVDVVVRVSAPLRLVGVDRERLGLMLALSVRSVPVVVALAEEVRDAQRARGLAASPRAFAVPLIVRSLRHADALGEALMARGVDD